MTRQNAAHAPWGVLIEQNPHPFEGVWILANRRTAFTRARGSSNISVAISSAVHPAFALSTTACAGTRVPLMTQAPDSLPGTLSTSSDLDQSTSSVIRRLISSLT